MDSLVPKALGSSDREASFPIVLKRNTERVITVPKFIAQKKV